jgi:hypothetical protein
MQAFMPGDTSKTPQLPQRIVFVSAICSAVGFFDQRLAIFFQNQLDGWAGFGGP